MVRTILNHFCFWCLLFIRFSTLWVHFSNLSVHRFSYLFLMMTLYYTLLHFSHGVFAICLFSHSRCFTWASKFSFSACVASRRSSVSTSFTARSSLPNKNDKSVNVANLGTQLPYLMMTSPSTHSSKFYCLTQGIMVVWRGQSNANSPKIVLKPV